MRPFWARPDGASQLSRLLLDHSNIQLCVPSIPCFHSCICHSTFTSWAIIVVVLVIVLLASTGGVNPGASLWLLPREDDGDEDVRSGGGNTTSVFAGQGGNGTFWWLP